MKTFLAHEQTANSGAPAQRHAFANESSPSVLVVEDDEDTRYLLKTLLEFRGAKVVEASNGEMALALAANLRLDLILMDGSLPLLDGLETMRRIRELASMCDVRLYSSPVTRNQLIKRRLLLPGAPITWLNPSILEHGIGFWNGTWSLASRIQLPPNKMARAFVESREIRVDQTWKSVGYDREKRF